ncbi:hypothetical protein FE257_006761 [Aspergillus nanangensis]|uniref:Cysteine-rich secreted protein n=1 Tax=Aspergillus nanangensis TaxID=2582783 RepID=A0AAD4GTS8_ASPNN|nr:hypothetical protein FE257_006761 [Aspergillus nanangensis]
MKSTPLGVFTLLLQASSIHAKLFRKNTPTFEVSPDATIIQNSIEYFDPDCEPGLQCRTTKTCSTAGTVPTLSQDRRYFACCPARQRLLGSADTVFDCCAVGHDLVGSADAGYHCCPTGWSYEGMLCRPPTKPTCLNGKTLVNGECACGPGTVEADDGTCVGTEQIPPIPPRCTYGSGISYGKCYTFKAANGNTLGSGADGIYYAGLDDMNFHYGKFQLCANEACTAGTNINPSDPIFIRDLYGDPKTGLNNGRWLNSAVDGAHIGKAPNLSTAGKFSLSKWPCGKYCLGGVEQGVGPACPATTPALTFFSKDPQMCVPFELLEVPCNIKDNANNCIWKNPKNQCCGGGLGGMLDCTVL